ncbi:MAG TPA: tetratricopeptide repeat protein [Bryobacteraceae bacterium]|nr:tetratricopeptide repeat protein [Bryobacteraceae bacterium]
MSRGRICATLIVAAALFPAAKTVLGQTDANGLPPPLVPKTELPPDEDQKTAPETFSFNPVQSQREMTAGDFYFKKGNYTAAAARYERATKWNDGNAEAWFRLGEAEEKKSNVKAAVEAYRKYLELSPDAKNASEVKKKLAKLKG